MKLLDFLKGPDINEGLKRMQEKQNAVLLDVRTGDEYQSRHIPGSINIPLDNFQSIERKIPHKETPLYVYCLSGARSSKAVRFLKRHGYTDVTDLGGIRDYRGETESGV